MCDWSCLPPSCVWGVSRQKGLVETAPRDVILQVHNSDTWREEPASNAFCVVAAVVVTHRKGMSRVFSHREVAAMLHFIL